MKKYCFSCKKELLEITLGDSSLLKVDKALVCINEKCPRVALLAVGGLQYVKIKKIKLKKEKNALRSKSSHQSHGKKS